MDLSNENVNHIKNNNLEYIQFKRLLKYSDKINHAYIMGLDKNFRTSRRGGTLEKGEYEKAVQCYKDVCYELNVDYKDIIKSNQNHTDNIEIISRKININKPDFDIYENTDGLITDKSGLTLSTTNADCILLLFYDFEKNIIANVHSGWKGTLKRISVKAINKMHDEYGCEYENIICCICPSIRKCHFEVDADVYKMFENEFKDMKNFDKIVEKRDNKWYIDTVLINKEILQEQGLRKENIEDSEICSVCNKDIIHSYRVEGDNYGLSTAIIALK